MKLTLNKKALKNLSKDSQILPADMTPEVGGGVTFACGTAACTIESAAIPCNSDQVCNGSEDCPTFLCGVSDDGCVSGWCGTGFFC